MKKVSKQEAKSPDQFIVFSDRAAKFITDHSKTILGILGAAFIFGAGTVAVEKFSYESELSAQEAYYQAKHALNVKMKELKKAEDGKAPASKTEADLQKNFSQVISLYQKVGESNPKSTAAIMAAMELAGLYSDYGLKDKAAATLAAVAEHVDRDDFYYGLLHAQLGTSYMDLKQYQKAIDQLSLVAQSKKQSYLQAEAILKMGVSYQQLQNYAKAKEMYSRVSEEHAASYAGRTAKSFLRLLLAKGEASDQG